MTEDSATQIDQIVAIFGSQVALARAIGIDGRNVTEWRRRNLGIPTKHYRKIFFEVSQMGKADELPGWFPRFSENGEAA